MATWCIKSGPTVILICFSWIEMNLWDEMKKIFIYLHIDISKPSKSKSSYYCYSYERRIWPYRLLSCYSKMYLAHSLYGAKNVHHMCVRVCVQDVYEYVYGTLRHRIRHILAFTSHKVKARQMIILGYAKGKLYFRCAFPTARTIMPSWIFLHFSWRENVDETSTARSSAIPRTFSHYLKPNFLCLNEFGWHDVIRPPS